MSTLIQINKNGQMDKYVFFLFSGVQVSKNQSSKASVVGDTNIWKVLSSEMDSAKIRFIR